MFIMIDVKFYMIAEVGSNKKLNDSCHSTQK